MDINYTLHPNIIGKIFGRPCIAISEDSMCLYILKKMPDETSEFSRHVINTYNLYDVGTFSKVTKNILGSTFVLNLKNETISFSFMSNAESSKFSSVLNKLISNNISASINGFSDELFEQVYVQYPKDSRYEQVRELFDSIYTNMTIQKEEIKTYIPDSELQNARSFISIYPVSIEVLRELHEQHMLEQRKEFYDNIETFPLTQEQRLAVVRNNDRNMVLAAAGTGKTSVVVAKALDIIDRKLALPSQILILAYNKAAADELKERMIEKASKSSMSIVELPKISTFHALGREVLKGSSVSTMLSKFTSDERLLKVWVSEWLENYLSADISNAIDMLKLFPEPVNPFNFKSDQEYTTYIQDNEFRTLNNEKVRGYQELRIANWLYMHQIDYKYEDRYISKQRIDADFDYRPDFHIVGTNIYIEHFGIARDGSTRADIDAEKYNKEMILKRETHLEHGTILIESYHYEWLEDTLFVNLEENLNKHGIIPQLMSHDLIYKKLFEGGKFSEWSELFRKALQVIRTERLEADLIYNRLAEARVSDPNHMTKLLTAMHEAYLVELEKENAIDFDDMIIRAEECITNSKYYPQWKYILVDEFQDISEARMRFVKTIIKHCDEPSLTVVGDDWQSIYRFSGGKLELTTEFEKHVGSYTMTILDKTFRYNNSIADIAGTFVMENPSQFKKNIITHTQVENSQVYHYSYGNVIDKDTDMYVKLVEILDKIHIDSPNGTVAIIARYNDTLAGCKKFLSTYNNRKKYAGMQINFWTFHKSKGLESEYCIIVGLKSGKKGFPSQNKDEKIIEALLPITDTYPFAEERRLMYVGITRAKKKTFLLTNCYSPSTFSNEFLKPKYFINLMSEQLKSRFRETFKCPRCHDGYFRLIEGKHGNYFLCSTGVACRLRMARVCPECESPMVDNKTRSECLNSECGNVIKICPRCGRPLRIRKSRFGEFYGCTGYAIEDDKCTYIEKI